MGEPVILYGKSGSGKTCSLRNFMEDEIFLINVADKRMPFRKKFKYTTIADDAKSIIKYIKAMPKQVETVKAYVIDDYGFSMMNYFMREHSKGRKGSQVYDMYNEIGDSVFDLIECIKHDIPNDIIVYIIMHEDLADDGNYKLRTVGRLCDEKVGLEGRVTICVRCINHGGEHKFLTNNDSGIGKSPMDMLPQEMDNDLKQVDVMIREYYDIAYKKEED